MTRDPVRALVLRLTVVTVAVLLSVSLVSFWSILGSFEQALLPKLQMKAQAVAEGLSRQIGRALAYDIPLGQLPGLSEALQLEVNRHEDIAYAVVADPKGGSIASAAEPPRRTAADEIVVTLRGRGDEAASLVLGLGLDPGYFARVLRELMLEVASQMLVSMLITFELLLLVVHLSLSRVNALKHAVERAEAGDFRGRIQAMSGPAGQVATACRDRLAEFNRRLAGRLQSTTSAVARYRFLAAGEPTVAPPVNLVFLRLPVFLFCLSEELSRPFMPAYAKSLSATAPWLSPDLAVSLPITLFMVVWAVSQPFGPWIARNLGRSSAFAAAAVLAAGGLAMTALADNLLWLLVWRCVTALGYGVVLITAQGMVVDHTTPSNRTVGLAHFIGALLSAGVCGPIAGGIIADQVGYSATLLVGACAALVAASILVWHFREVSPSARASALAPVPPGSARALLKNHRYLAVIVLSAIPTKIAATGVLFCLIPLMLADSGASKSDIGRIQMLYFLAFMVCSPLVASLSDRWRSRRGFIVAGGLVTLVSMLPLLYLTDMWVASLAIGLFGAAQSMIGAPQVTLLTQIAQQAKVPELVAIGWYRLLERLGGAIGPMLAIAFTLWGSYRDALVGIGVLCAVSAAALWWWLRAPASLPGPPSALESSP